MLPGCTRILAGLFILSVALQAQTLTTLYDFCSQASGACGPSGGLILGPQGVLYGIAGLLRMSFCRRRLREEPGPRRSSITSLTREHQLEA